MLKKGHVIPTQLFDPSFRDMSVSVFPVPST